MLGAHVDTRFPARVPDPRKRRKACPARRRLRQEGRSRSVRPARLAGARRGAPAAAIVSLPRAVSGYPGGSG
jgi:hypothetical protein